MAANEIAERLAAACWVQCGGAGGEAINALDPAQIRYRSLVGFQQRIITTTNALLLPVLILPLDRTFSRTECAVFATRHATCGPFAGSRSPYPTLGAAVPNVPNVFAHPILLEWLGPDLANPTFFPFGIANGAIAVAPPVGANLELFDAIAVVLPTFDEAGLSGDFSVLVLKHPPIEGVVTELEPDLPAPDSGAFQILRAWFRADTYETGGEGDNLSELLGRLGTEGNLDANLAYSEPTGDPILNNQDVVGPGSAPLVSTMPPSFWDFLGDGPFTFYGVFYPTLDDDTQDLLWNAGITLSVGVGAGGDLMIELTPAWTSGNASLVNPNTTIDVGQWVKVVAQTGVGLLLAETELGSAPLAPIGTPVGGAAPGTLTVMGAPAQGGQLAIAELLFWAVALTEAQQIEVEAYLTARYATPPLP